MAIPRVRAENGSPHSSILPRRRRRRRPSFWDMRTYPYLSPDAVPTTGASNHFRAQGGGLRSGPLGRSSDDATWPPPGPQDVVYVPSADEKGPLAGIDVPALLAILTTGTAASVRASIGNGRTSGVEHGGSMDTKNATSVSRAPDSTSSVPIQPSAGPPDSDMQVTRHARRLYVGNLPAGTTELQIGDFFSRALVASKGSESVGDPIISVYINIDKRFAFIETRTVREAAAGLCLDGVRFQEVFLRVRRPNDFVGSAISNQTRPPDGFNPSILGIVSTQVSDGPNKMFIGGIPYNLTEDQVKELLQSYGPLAAFNLIKEPISGLSKGFAFFEYVDGSVAEAACEGLHGMKVGDKTLTVRRATQSMSNNNATHASGLGGLNGHATSQPVTVSTLIRESTRVVELCNIASAYELNNEEEYKEIFEDIYGEAEKFGRVEKVILPRASDSERTDVGIGNAYICYSTDEEAERAQIVFDGRKFGEHTIEARFFSEERFQNGEF